MKRIVMWALFLMIALGSAEAQNTPTKGNVSTEIQFNPFGMDGKIFKLDALRFRYFFTDNAALRLNWGMEVNKDSYVPNKEEMDILTKMTSGSFNLDLGVEKHYYKQERLDLYFGLQLGYEKNFISQKRRYQNGRVIKYENYNSNGDRASWAMNFDIFTGLDFFIYKSLYVGTELGLDLSYVTLCETRYIDGYNENVVRSDDRSSTFKAVFEVQPCVRLGWTF